MAVIPGPRGLAGLATWAAFVRSPQTMLMGLHRRHGKVCALGLGRLHYTCLFGAEANRYLLIDHADQFTAREANQVLTLTDGHTAVTVSDGDDHKRRRRVLVPAFRKQVIDAYLSHMVAGIDRLLASLRVGDEIDLYAPLRRVVAEVALQALFGDEMFERASELRGYIDVLLRYSNRPFFLQVKLRAPGTGWARFLAARDAFDAVVYDAIERRARSAELRPDVLSLLLAARDDTGRPISRVEMRDQIMALIMAGYGTTSASLAWGIAAMLQHREVWDRARQESIQVLGDRPPAADTLPGLTYVDHVVSEVLRVHDPFLVGARTAIQPFEFAGYRIPAGSTVIFSPYVTHRLPELWVTPEAFDPDRWEPGSASHRALPDGAYLPFNLGPRRCLGASYAQTFMRLAFAQFVRRTTLELTAPVTPRGHLLVDPRALRVRVRARSEPAS